MNDKHIEYVISHMSKNTHILPLHTAVKNDNIKHIKSLYDAGFNMSSVDIELKMAMFYTYNEEIIKLLISYGVDVNIKSYIGDSVLCGLHCMSTLKILILNGANVNTVDMNGCTLIYEYIWDGRLDSVRLLVKLGADLSVVDNDGISPLNYAIQVGFIDVIEYL